MPRRRRQPLLRRARFARKLAAYVGAIGTATGGGVACGAVVSREYGPLYLDSGSFELDLNLDTLTDFVFHLEDVGCDTSTGTSSSSSSRGAGACHYTHGLRVLIQGLGDNRVSGINHPAGVPLSAADATLGSASLGYYATSSTFWTFKGGEFSGNRGFVALKFLIPGSGQHVGWAEVQVWDDFNDSPLELYAIAYESIPLQTIVAGDLGSLNRPGDTNADGKVDINDLNNVRNNFGSTGLGDATGDGTVDIEDLNAVRNYFGSGQPSPVPEPPSLVLLAAGAAGLAMLRRRRAKHEQDDVAAGG